MRRIYEQDYGHVCTEDGQGFCVDGVTRGKDNAQLILADIE